MSSSREEVEEEEEEEEEKDVKEDDRRGRRKEELREGGIKGKRGREEEGERVVHCPQNLYNLASHFL